MRWGSERYILSPPPLLQGTLFPEHMKSSLHEEFASNQYIFNIDKFVEIFVYVFNISFNHMIHVIGSLSFFDAIEEHLIICVWHSNPGHVGWAVYVLRVGRLGA